MKLDSGEAPDIICVDTPVGLTSSIHMDQYSVELTGQEWVSRMEDSARSAVSVDDKVYGITFPGAKMYFYLYNKDIFSRLGLEAPVTYEEFRTVCQTIQDSGTTPIDLCGKGDWKAGDGFGCERPALLYTGTVVFGEKYNLYPGG